MTCKHCNRISDSTANLSLPRLCVFCLSPFFTFYAALFAHCVSRRCVRHTIHSSFCAYFYALSIELNLYDSIFGSFCVRSENRFTQILAKFEALWRPYCFIIFNFFFLFRSGHVCFISVPILV